MAIIIGDRLIGYGEKPYIIAEAATQFCGRPNSAKLIVRRAARLGADAIKFQMFLPGEELFCPLEGDEKRWSRWSESFMKPKQWRQVKACCDDLGIDFLCSAFQHSAIRLLRDMDVKAFKVASRAAETFPYDSLRQPKIISTGMKHPPCPPTNGLLLQCRSEYPHAPEPWKSGEGLSDHSGSPWPAIQAMARGAGVIEVHVLFYGRKDDPDALSSIRPAELKLLADARDNFAFMRSN